MATTMRGFNFSERWRAKHPGDSLSESAKLDRTLRLLPEVVVIPPQLLGEVIEPAKEPQPPRAA